MSNLKNDVMYQIEELLIISRFTEFDIPTTADNYATQTKRAIDYYLGRNENFTLSTVYQNIFHMKIMSESARIAQILSLYLDELEQNRELNKEKYLKEND